MGGQSAFGFYDADAHLVSYYFMGDYAIRDIKKYLKEPYNVLKDCARPMFEGNCLLDEFKSQKFQDEHDLVGAVLIMRDCIICYDQDSIVVYRKRKTD
jgi:mRNA-degrading endonuclease YafQ of YafQ-DinJ toxin-antitoxin module